MPARGTPIQYEIAETIGTISESRGWYKELNLVSWNGAEPKFDLRTWAPDHEKMGKGITFSRKEAEILYDLLGQALGK